MNTFEQQIELARGGSASVPLHSADGPDELTVELVAIDRAARTATIAIGGLWPLHEVNQYVLPEARWQRVWRKIGDVRAVLYVDSSTQLSISRDAPGIHSIDVVAVELLEDGARLSVREITG